MMNKMSRRRMLRVSAGAPALNMLLAKIKNFGIAVVDVDFDFENFAYRTPIKFGGTVVDRVTLLNVTCAVRTQWGYTAKGFGSMPLGNVWSFPSKDMSYETTLNAMKALAGRIAKITLGLREYGHPIDLNRAAEPQYLAAATELSTKLSLAHPIPKLCTLVTASPFDAALHDAYGKVHKMSSYVGYGADSMPLDLSHYLGPAFAGEWLDRYVLPDPKPRMPLYHLVGAVDPIVDEDIKTRLNDGMPETLPEWINYNGLTHIKIKLNGDDLDWDVNRVVRVDQASAETQKKRGVDRWVYSLDFNEKCRDVDYLMAFLEQVRAKTPAGFERIQYIEQPTKRDLQGDRSNVMHQASKLRPVVIDESLTDLESLLLAKEMGYTGAALKACKGQSQALLMAAAAQKFKMFLCVQDLTCPGASLIHSAGLAAHIPSVAAIEANSRQYVPAANKAWESKFPGIFIVKDGMMKTGELTGRGLSVVS